MDARTSATNFLSLRREPVSFALRDDDQMIVDTLTAFADEQLRPRLRAAETARSLAQDVTQTFAEMGFEALDLPNAAGGAGLGMLTRVLVNRCLAQADAGAALALDRIGPAAYVLEAFGGVEAVTRHVAPILDDPAARLALVIEDVDRHAAAGDMVVGSLAWLPATRADVVVGRGPTSAWVLQGPAAVEPVPGSGLLAAGASRLRFEGCVQNGWTDRQAARTALAKTRVYHAALILGVLYDATEFSRRYAMDRVAFGQPVAHHQGMAFLIVELFVAVEQCRLLVEDAARRLEAGEEAAQRAAAAFVEAVEASRFVGPNGVQILGGHGFMRDFPMEKAMRDCRALGLLAGGVERAQDDAGEDVGEA